MSMWDRKRVGVMVDAIGFYASETDNPEVKAALLQVRQHALAVEHLPHVTPRAAQDVQHNLCTFCKTHELLNCTGISESCSCDFLDIANLDSRPPRH